MALDDVLVMVVHGLDDVLQYCSLDFMVQGVDNVNTSTVLLNV